MYNPLNSLQEMWKTPNYVLFKVLINGKEYYGRPSSAIIEPFDNILSTRFNRYNSLISAQSGSLGEEVILKPIEVIGLEAFDSLSTKSPSPFLKILKACNEIDQQLFIKQEEVIIIIDNLIQIIEEFIDEHPKAYEEAMKTIDLLNYAKMEFENEEFSLSKIELLKERISDIVGNFFYLQS